MWLIIYFLIGWFIYSFLREIIFNRNEGISILEYTIENGITPEELDFKLFVLSLSSLKDSLNLSSQENVTILLLLFFILRVSPESA